MANDLDFTTANHGSITILTPLTEAARGWCEEHIPADCPLWGRNGFAIETNYVGAILDGMAEDGLAGA